MSEHLEQKCLFSWLALHEQRNPCLKMIFAIPNGGHRHMVVAKKLKAEGVKSGVPDIFLPCLRADGVGGVLPGLFIEMKYGKDKETDNQRWWREQLKRQGYESIVCYSWPEAARAICEYLGLDRLLKELDGLT